MVDEPTPAAARVRTRHELARDLFDAFERSPDGVLITNGEGVIEYTNPAFADLTGYRRDEIVGRTPAMFASGAHGHAFYSELWTALRAGQPFRATFVDRRGDGALVHLEETIAPVVDSAGRVTICMASARDVTEKIHADAAVRHLNEALENQARRIAERLHDEAGQLLTAAYIALADAVRQSPDARDPLEEVRVHLDGLEDQLRQLAHELRPQVLDDLGLVAALESLADGIARRWRLPVTVEGSVRNRLPSLVEATMYRFCQEALRNVCRHARASHAVVRLAQEPQALRCTVRDDGVGFDTAHVLNASGRTGMGLTAIRERVAALGGTLHIDSSPGGGTSVTATVPLEV